MLKNLNGCYIEMEEDSDNVTDLINNIVCNVIDKFHPNIILEIQSRAIRQLEKLFN